LKTILTISNKDEEFERDNNEDLSLLVKNIQRMFHKSGHFNNHRKIWQGKEERREIEIGPCYNCKKPDHLIADCPDIKSKASTSKKLYKKKAIKTTWDSESEFDGESTR